jgi:hypothetical protein
MTPAITNWFAIAKISAFFKQLPLSEQAWPIAGPGRDSSYNHFQSGNGTWCFPSGEEGTSGSSA